MMHDKHAHHIPTHISYEIGRIQQTIMIGIEFPEFAVDDVEVFVREVVVDLERRRRRRRRDTCASQHMSYPMCAHHVGNPMIAIP